MATLGCPHGFWDHLWYFSGLHKLVGGHPRITAETLGVTPSPLSGPTLVGWPPLNHTLHFPSPSLVSLTLELRGVSLVSWLLHQVLGCTPKSHMTCICPASRTKKQVGGSDRDINSFMDGALTCLKQGPGVTLQCAADGRRDLAAGFAPGGEGKLLITGGIDTLPGKPAEEHRPLTISLMKNPGGVLI